MKKLMRVLSFSLFFIVEMAHSGICEQMGGEWVGNWVEQRFKHYSARLEIRTPVDRKFWGNYYLATNNRGHFRGVCKQVAPDEAILTLAKDPPCWNPCRGTLMQTKQGLSIHFYCFKPDQAGFFSKKAVVVVEQRVLRRPPAGYK